MDKYEYKVRADEIKALIAEGDYAEAVKIADTIDWRRVKSVMMLCTVSDLYKINRRYQESKDILLLAYEKHPTGRLIVYSLCELSIKMEEVVQAIEYYKEFVQIAPRDTGRYILQYRLYEAQDVSLEERIAVLEEFKKRDYREKWAYELAYLYHRIGLTTKCVEECDEMFLWFGEGKYVLKALELKALHRPLTADQQMKYDIWVALRDAEIEEEKAQEMAAAKEEAEVLQNLASAESAEDFGETRVYGAYEDSSYEDAAYEDSAYPEEQPIEEPATAELPEVKTVDVGQYNTINLQMALAESMKEIMDDELPQEAPEVSEEALLEEAAEELPEEELLASELPEDDLEDTTEELTEITPPQAVLAEEQEEAVLEEAVREQEEVSIAEKLIAPLLEETREIPRIVLPEETDELQEINTAVSAAESVPTNVSQPHAVKPELSPGIPGAKTGVLTPLNTQSTKFDSVLSQEYDGQISLVIPDATAIEKQITGQLSIKDVMAEWEEMKKDNEQKRMEAVKKRILEHTGSLFADFDEATKTGLLEQLEKAFVAAIMKESEKPPIKKVILPDEAEKELEEVPQTDAPKQAVKITSMTNTVVPEQKAAAAETAETLTDNIAPEDEVEELEEIEETNAVTEELPKETVTEEELPKETVIEESPKEAAAEDVKSAAAEEEAESAEETKPTVQQARSQQAAREMTEEEKELFGQFIHHNKTKKQLVLALDNMSLASYTGNIMITGEEKEDTIALAKGLIREMQYNDSNFSGKVAKVSGAVLNKKEVAETLAKLNNGALIIEDAADMKAETITKVCKVLQKDNMGLLLILEDKKQPMNRMLSKNPDMAVSFELRVDIEPLDDEALVAYAKQYAEDNEYSIDEFGVLALHTRIADMQTSDHEVTLADVRELVDEAIYYANKKTPKHFVDVLLAKRYDEEDMIILREKDFMHY